MTEKYFAENFGKLLKVRRLMLGMSQEQLGAKALKRDKSAISRYENGRFDTISPQIIKALSEAVRITEDELSDCFMLNDQKFHQKYFKKSDIDLFNLKSGWNSHPSKMELYGRRPSELLVSKNRVVDYIDSPNNLGEITDWCYKPRPEIQGRLYTAPAGFGKTRFGIEIGVQLNSPA